MREWLVRSRGHSSRGQVFYFPRWVRDVIERVRCEETTHTACQCAGLPHDPVTEFEGKPEPDFTFRRGNSDLQERESRPRQKRLEISIKTDQVLGLLVHRCRQPSVR